eukprot:SAG31_NODE_871_length_11335_cov_4.910822_11_plen_78_part_00
MTVPEAPVVLAKLDTHTTSSTWRDIKVFRNVAYIGSEASGHGVQIYDLTELRQYYGKVRTTACDDLYQHHNDLQGCC